MLGTIFLHVNRFPGRNVLNRTDDVSAACRVPLPLPPPPTRPASSRHVPSLQMIGGAGGVADDRNSDLDGARVGPPPDLPSLLLHNRIVYLGMPLVPAVTELIIAEVRRLRVKYIGSTSNPAGT